MPAGRARLQQKGVGKMPFPVLLIVLFVIGILLLVVALVVGLLL